MKGYCAALLVCALGGWASMQATKPDGDQRAGDTRMKLGNFSVSLTVKDLAASRAFYEKLDFRMVAGDPTKNWIVMQNGAANIGLFQGMFDKNILTFNPGWDSSKRTLAEFDDVREIQAQLKKRGITPVLEADAASTGPASLMVVDPDGNQILIDQHVSKPKN